MQLAGTTPASVPVNVTAAASDAERPPEPALYPDEVTALALTPPQLTAIQKMLSGHSLGAAADEAGVTRMTLYRWFHKDPKFRAAYNAWQADAITSVRTKLLSMSDAAVSTIGRAVKSDPKIALEVLKALAERHTIIAEDGADIVGWAGFGPCRDPDAAQLAEVYGIYLHPEHYRKGFGKALWSEACRQLAGSGYSEVAVWVLSANTRARRFYEAMGCALEVGIEKVLTREGARLPEVRYRRRCG